MKKSKEKLGSNFEKIDAHVVHESEYEDAPESTDELIATDKMVRMGRPKKKHTKQAIKIRVDPFILASYKSMGKGWQTNMHKALEEWIQHQNP